MSQLWQGRWAALRLACFVVALLTIILLFILPSPVSATAPVVARIDSLWTSDQRDAAVSLLEAELPRARAAGDSSLITNLLVVKGAFNNFLGNSRLAETVLLEGVAMARARQDSTLLMTGLRWLGLAVGSQGRRSEAVVLYEELLQIGVRLGDRKHQGWANIGMAWSNWREGNAEVALAQYESAARLFADTDDVQGELWANNGIAAINSNLGRYEQAAAGYQATIEVARSHDRPMPEAVALNNLGSLEYSLGRSDVAVGYFQQARALHVRLRSMRQQLPPLHNIAMCQNDMGQHAAARQTLTEALALCDEYGYRDLRSRTLVKMANMEMQRQHLNQAAALIQEARQDPETMMVIDVVEAEIELGEAYRRQKKFAAASRGYARADSFLGQRNFPWVRLRLMGHQAKVLRDLGKYRRARDQFLDLVETASAASMPQYRLAALSDAAETSLLMARPDTARILYEAAAKVWEDDRRQLLSPQWRERRGASGREIFPDLALLIHEAGEPSTAFNRLQSYKSRTLLERMLGPGEFLTKSLDLVEDRRVCLSDLQTTVLADDELLLDFTVGPRVSLLYAVTRDTMVLRRLPASGLITERVRAYYQLLKDPAAGSPAAVAAVGAGVRDMLLSDLPTVFAAKDRVLVVPDGVLNLLPFADFVIPDRRPDWVRVPSASVLARLRQADRRGGDGAWKTLAVASGWGLDAVVLAGTLQEVEQLARDYQGVETRVLKEEETELPQLLGFDILHLAAHASNDDQNPWQSAIRFLPDEQGGRLRATDVLNLQLDARLAVLSSCSSGTGQIITGEGVLGLSTAFLGAGVPTVLASLWAVDDGATARFMQLYYGYLADGQDCARSLTSAQQDLRAEAATVHPYYWAGFVVIGEGHLHPHLVRSQDWLVSASLGLLACGLLMSVALLRRR